MSSSIVIAVIARAVAIGLQSGGQTCFGRWWRFVVEKSAGDGTDVLAALRHRTSAAHERLHVLEPFAQLLAGTIRPDAYAGLMAGMLDFYAAFDTMAAKAAARFGRHIAPYAYEPRVPHIAADLLALGGRDPLGDAGDPPGRAGGRLATPASAAALGGMLYVVDGATLGGSVLSRPAARLYPSGGTDGYWNWCRARGGAQWRTTLALLPRLAPDGAAMDAMTRSAVETFAVFEACLTPTALPARTGARGR